MSTFPAPKPGEPITISRILSGYSASGITLDVAQEEVGRWAASTFPDHTSKGIAFHIQEKALKLSMAIYGIRPGDWEDDAAGILVLLLTLFAHEGSDVAAALRREHRRNTSENTTWVADETGLMHRRMASAQPETPSVDIPDPSQGRERHP